MSWRDQLLDASFRGVPFYVASASTESARGIVSHEYPAGGEAGVEEITRKSDRITLQAYVIGRDYFGARDALIAALQQAGPGDLVHPYHGYIRVQMVSSRLTESTSRGGYAEFNLEFLRVPSAGLISPLASVDTAAALEETATVAADAADAQFAADYQPASGTILDAAIAAAEAALNQIEDIAGKARSNAEQASRLAMTPARLAARLRADISGLASIASLRRLYYYTAPAPSTSRRGRANSQALTQRVQEQAVTSAALTLSAASYASYDEAIAARDEVIEQIDRVTDTSGPATASALRTLRSAVVAHIQAGAGDLARLTRYTPSETLPAILIAHQLYGSALALERAADLVARNGVAHALFVPGGRTLSVLSD